MAWCSLLQYLTNGLVQGSNVKDGVSWIMSGDIKGQPLAVAVEAGAEDTGSGGYWWSEEEGDRKKGVWIQLG